MQRLSGLDASFLYFETRSQLLHVCGLVELDPSTMPGGYSFDKLKEEMSRRVAGMPSFRRKLHDSVLNVDHPVWVEDDEFNIDNHMRRMGLPTPGTKVELSELCGHLAGLPMDRTIPLWEMVVIEGMENGRVAAFVKMHHATVDGVSGANMMSQLCTLTPDDPSLSRELVEQHSGGVSALELAAGGIFSRLAIPFKLMSLLPKSLKVLPSWINRARKGLAMPAPFTAPRVFFNRNVTGHRSIAFGSMPFEDVKRIKNVFGTTVNDVVLALCASALRSYLESLGELPSKPLIAMVPMSVHDADPRPGTNRVSGIFMSLATDIEDPIERLEIIRDHNVVAKNHNKAIDANLLTDWAQFAAPSVFGSAVRMYSRLRLSERHPVVYNLLISNVPGPTFPLYFLGCKIDRMLPLGPVFHGAGLNCTVITLNGELHVGLIACRDLIPDLWPLVDFVPEALQTYLDAADEREAQLAAVDTDPPGEASTISTTSTRSRSRSSVKSRRRVAVSRKRSTRSGRDTQPVPARRVSDNSGSDEPVQKARASATPVEETPSKTGSGSTASSTKSTAKKAPAKKAAAKKAAAKKAAAKKAAATKPTPAATSTKRTTTAKTETKKKPVKKTAAKKAPARKPVAEKPVPRNGHRSKSVHTGADSTPSQDAPDDRQNSRPQNSNSTTSAESTGRRGGNNGEGYDSAMTNGAQRADDHADDRDNLVRSAAKG